MNKQQTFKWFVSFIDRKTVANELAIVAHLFAIKMVFCCHWLQSSNFTIQFRAVKESLEVKRSIWMLPWRLQFIKVNALTVKCVRNMSIFLFFFIWFSPSKCFAIQSDLKLRINSFTTKSKKQTLHKVFQYFIFKLCSVYNE